MKSVKQNTGHSRTHLVISEKNPTDRGKRKKMQDKEWILCKGPKTYDNVMINKGTKV